MEPRVWETVVRRGIIGKTESDRWCVEQFRKSISLGREIGSVSLEFEKSMDGSYVKREYGKYEI